MYSTDLYKKIIEIFATKEIDYKGICVRLAQNDPDLFLEYADPLATLEEWQQEALEDMKAGRRIQAIRICRNETGWGLKESKEAVDKFMEEHDLKAKNDCWPNS